MAGPCAERVRELLEYSPETGEFRHKASRGGVLSGSVAGCLYANGYRKITIDGRGYLAHRVAWLYVHGEWPATGIDHANGDKDDNRLCNLRMASQSQNMQNILEAPHLSRSGLFGAAWDKARNKWQASIRVDGKRRYLGRFETAEDASAAYLSAKEKLHTFHRSAGDAT